MPKPKPPMSRPGELPQPHDALFKWTFSQREHAVGLLQAALPPALVAAIDWSTLRVEKGSFVDRALRSRHSDLVLSARLGDERLFFYAILEQQRDVEPLMVFRLGLYMMRLWDQLLRDHPDMKRLPPIVPILIHHSATGWTAATAFQDIVGPEGPARATLVPHIPHFELRLIDLHSERASDLVDEALTALGQVVLWCLSVANDDARLQRDIVRIARSLDEVLHAPDGLTALEALLRYLVATHGRFSARRVVKLLEDAAGPQAQETIMTLFDEIELRGEKRGEKRGERRGRAQTLLELLAVRFGPVPPATSARILAADESALTQWTGRVLTAPTLKKVIGEDREPAPPTRPAAPRKRSRPAARSSG
jgi:Putative transposase, YhgA-like